MSGPHWGEFEQRAPRAPVEADDRRDIAAVAFRLSLTTDGRDLLAYLRSITVDRRSAPGLPDAVIREAEGKRQLLHHIEDLIETGRELATNKPQ